MSSTSPPTNTTTTTTTTHSSRDSRQNTEDFADDLIASIKADIKINRELLKVSMFSTTQQQLQGKRHTPPPGKHWGDDILPPGYQNHGSPSSDESGKPRFVERAIFYCFLQ